MNILEIFKMDTSVSAVIVSEYKAGCITFVHKKLSVNFS